MAVLPSHHRQEPTDQSKDSPLRRGAAVAGTVEDEEEQGDGKQRVAVRVGVADGQVVEKKRPDTHPECRAERHHLGEILTGNPIDEDESNKPIGERAQSDPHLIRVAGPVAHELFAQDVEHAEPQMGGHEERRPEDGAPKRKNLWFSRTERRVVQ